MAYFKATSVGSALCVHVFVIIPPIALEQVFWIHAQRIVAMVAHVWFNWPTTIVQVERKPVS